MLYYTVGYMPSDWVTLVKFGVNNRDYKVTGFLPKRDYKICENQF